MKIVAKVDVGDSVLASPTLRAGRTIFLVTGGGKLASLPGATAVMEQPLAKISGRPRQPRPRPYLLKSPYPWLARNLCRSLA